MLPEAIFLGWGFFVAAADGRRWFATVARFRRRGSKPNDLPRQGVPTACLEQGEMGRTASEAQSQTAGRLACCECNSIYIARENSVSPRGINCIVPYLVHDPYAVTFKWNSRFREGFFFQNGDPGEETISSPHYRDPDAAISWWNSWGIFLFYSKRKTWRYITIFLGYGSHFEMCLIQSAFFRVIRLMTDAGHGGSIAPVAAGFSDGCHRGIVLRDGSRCSLPKAILHGRLPRLGANKGGTHPFTWCGRFKSFSIWPTHLFYTGI